MKRSAIGTVEGDSAAEAGGAAAAILLSAAAVEAWLSEYLAYIEMKFPAEVELLEIRFERDVQKQFKKLLRIRTPSFACGSSPEYEDLGCLFRLRDHVAHRSARFMPVSSWPPKLRDCVAKGRIPVGDSAGMDWTSVVYQADVAFWAATAAARWIGKIVALIPDGPSGMRRGTAHGG